MDFDMVYRQPDGLKASHITRDRLRVRNARDPADESVELGRQTPVARQVAETEASTWHEDPSNLPCRRVLVWKRTVGALAEHSIKGCVGKSAQLLRVTLEEVDAVEQSFALCLLPGARDVGATVVDTNHPAANNAREVQRGRPWARRKIEHPARFIEPEQLPEPFG